MLLGEYKHNIDSKGRLIIPAKFRGDLGDRFIITRGLDGCLFGYPLDAWSKLQEKLSQLPLAKKESRAVTRFFYSAATECELDRQGRVNLPQSLIDHAELNKECVVIGVSNRFEIWDEDRWETYSAAAGDEFDEMAEDMLDFGF